MGENGGRWDPKNFPWVPQAACATCSQPDPQPDVGEHHHHAEEGPRRAEDEGARFTRLTMRVAEMIKLQSDAKRGMYTCLECGRAKSRGKTRTR